MRTFHHQMCVFDFHLATIHYIDGIGWVVGYAQRSMMMAFEREYECLSVLGNYYSNKWNISLKIRIHDSCGPDQYRTYNKVYMTIFDEFNPFLLSFTYFQWMHWCLVYVVLSAMAKFDIFQFGFCLNWMWQCENDFNICRKNPKSQMEFECVTKWIITIVLLCCIWMWEYVRILYLFMFINHIQIQINTILCEQWNETK